VDPNVRTRSPETRTAAADLLNLCSNAIKFTPPGGEVVVEALPAGSQDGRNLIHFDVRDSGVGMSKEVVSRLFRPFTQPMRPRPQIRRHRPGTVDFPRLIELMGGLDPGRKRAGKGSTFHFISNPLRNSENTELQRTPCECKPARQARAGY